MSFGAKAWLVYSRCLIHNRQNFKGFHCLGSALFMSTSLRAFVGKKSGKKKKLPGSGWTAGPSIVLACCMCLLCSNQMSTQLEKGYLVC